jgi:hypothetical protein
MLGQRPIHNITDFMSARSLAPVGFRRDGSPIWPVFGAEDNAPGNGDGTDNSNDDGSGNGSDDGNSGAGSESDKDKDKDKNDAVSRSDYEALKARMQAADKRASDTAAELKKLQDKEKSELELAKGEAETAKAELVKRDDVIKRLRLENAFLSSGKHEWQTPGDALALADMSGVTIDDDGKVSGLDAAMDKLAKDKPYLLKTSTEGKGPDGKEKSGDPVGGGKNGKPDDKTRQQLMDKYPALRR